MVLWRRGLLILLIMYNVKILIALVMFTSCTTQSSYKQSSVVPNPYSKKVLDSSVKRVYLDAVNTMRSKGRMCGSLGYFPAAPALKWNNMLYHAALEHSADMLESNTFSHHGSGAASDWTAKVQHLGRRSKFIERIENNGYLKWRRLAQNIASGMASVEDTMKQWETSEYHCANIMNPVFREFGMAHTKRVGKKFTHYWTQNFAAPQ